MSRNQWPLAAIGAALTMLLLSCGSSDGVEPSEVTRVPEAWIEDSRDGWPSSDAFGASMPVLRRDACLLLDDLPEMLGSTAEFTNSGWGPLGPDRTNEDAYVYTCEFRSKNKFAGSLAVFHPGSEDAAQKIVSSFRNQPNIPEQDNTVTTESVHKLDIHVVTRWYPTNPQGRYIALYHDEAADVVTRLEINSLSEASFKDFSAEQAASTLVDLLARGSTR